MGVAGYDAGLEQLAWQDPAMSSGHSARCLRQACLPEYWQRFASLPCGWQLAALDAMLRQHRAHNPLLAHIEVLAWASHARPEAVAQRTEQVREAHSVLQRFAMSPWQFAHLPRASVTDFMWRWVKQADRATREKCSSAMARMWVALHREQNGAAALPDSLPGLAAVDLLAALGPGPAAQPYWLGIDPVRRCLCLFAYAPPAPFLLDAEPLYLAGCSVEVAGQLRWLVVQPGQDLYLAHLPWPGAVAPNAGGDVAPAGAGPLADVPLLHDSVRLDTGQVRITLGELVRPLLPTLPDAPEPRPLWALEWARDRAGAYLCVPNPWGTPLRVAYPYAPLAPVRMPLPAVAGAPAAAPVAAPRGVLAAVVDWVRGKPKPVAPAPARQPRLLEWTLAVDEIGPLATFVLEAANGQHRQTLRYIPPGQFWMGSPDDEPERWDVESPQHRVTISNGFWLADTACTQGLWQAVMGGNPSHFHSGNGGGPSHPVAQVSWHRAQEFLQALQPLLPTCQVSLPTEAEWEYACRAGSITPFWFGATISPAQANYDGNHPYNGGEQGVYREKTVQVQEFAPNPWGLYQMCGNVWEWCGDEFRTYTVDEVQDPGLISLGQVSADAKVLRALRGGCWFGSAHGLRSACRIHDQPGWRIRIAGFRLALRSSGTASGF